jgi:signal transduction histidine kinase
MHTFLSNNRDELIRRCKEKVARRPRRAATANQLRNGVPMFLDQLTRTLAADEAGEGAASERISGVSGGVAPVLSEMSVTAAAHGKELLELGYTVDQVVHDYGDLCQAVTDLAFERDAPFAVDEFRTLNRCLDNAIADAVSEFSFHRDASLDEVRSVEANERIGLLVHELRNALQTGNLSVRALELGSLSLSGATGVVLKRSLAAMGTLIDRALVEVRSRSAVSQQAGIFPLAALIADAEASGELRAAAAGCKFTVGTVDPLLGLHANYALLLSALENLLQNAFKFTQAHTEVKLTAYAAGPRVLIDVSDHCGGLPAGDVDRMFIPFFQQSSDKTGVGLGLLMARRAIEADGGELTVRDLPGVGCVFTISLPRQSLQSGVGAPESTRPATSPEG